jgi:hypothetical protein
MYGKFSVFSKIFFRAFRFPLQSFIEASIQCVVYSSVATNKVRVAIFRYKRSRN